MSGMDVLVVGSGGREHAIAIGLAQSKSVSSVHCLPGNAGTSFIAKNHDIPLSDLDAVVNLAEELDISLVVVGPEVPLVDGLADKLRHKSIPCFGPNSEGAMLEGSKLHAKQVMSDLGIPTGRFEVLERTSRIEDIFESFKPPWVIKRDVLAGGKGVIVTSSKPDARSAIESWIALDGFVIIEEHLAGEEASVLVILDESGYVVLPASQDHKRVGNYDAGPNTGGMGAYAPAPIVTSSVLSRVKEQIIEPMHNHIMKWDFPYRGCLYLGLMIDEEGYPSVVEFNVRLGDPEAQVTIPLIDSDFGILLRSAAEGRISEIDVTFKKMYSSTVVLASEGYPGETILNRPIIGWDSIVDEGQISGFTHIAGASIDKEGQLLSSGGRVLSTTGVAPTLEGALSASYQIIEGIELQGSHYRSDIGFRALS